MLLARQTINLEEEKARKTNDTHPARNTAAASCARPSSPLAGSGMSANALRVAARPPCADRSCSEGVLEDNGRSSAGALPGPCAACGLARCGLLGGLVRCGLLSALPRGLCAPLPVAPCTLLSSVRSLHSIPRTALVKRGRDKAPELEASLPSPLSQR